MGDVVYKNFRRQLPLPEHHKGWPATTAVHDNRDINGLDGEQRLAARERAIRRGEAMDEVMKKFTRREEFRRSLSVIQPDIDRDR